MPVESPSFSPNPGGVCGGGRVAGRVDVQARVVYVSEWVCVFAVPIYFLLLFYSSFCFG